MGTWRLHGRALIHHSALSKKTLQEDMQTVRAGQTFASRAVSRLLSSEPGRLELLITKIHKFWSCWNHFHCFPNFDPRLKGWCSRILKVVVFCKKSQKTKVLENFLQKKRNSLQRKTPIIWCLHAATRILGIMNCWKCFAKLTLRMSV